MFVIIQQFTRSFQRLVNVTANDFRKGIPAALFERK